ncbi:rRNA pseudouridine synthase [bacterium]|nr:MAG: rRNA pseudouridine synthase [bacterium]
METRLNKYVAANSEFARRKSDELIEQGRVTVNNKVVLEPGTQIKPGIDDVRLDGEKLKEKTKKIYILLNKPAGIITSTDDEKNRQTVIDVLNIRDKVFPVGRLDYETTGLLILTNDGDFTNLLTHPSHRVPKTYIVKLSKILEEKHKDKLTAGIKIEGRKTAPAKITFPYKSDLTTVSITITEGRNRQVRRMFEFYGYFVRKLHRASYGILTLGALKPGEWRRLTIQEVNQLKTNYITKGNDRTKRTHKKTT